MNPSRSLAAAVLAFAFAGAAGAEGVSVTDPWARSTVPGQKVAGVFMELKSDRDSALVAATSPDAATVEIHSTSMDGGVMRMRAVDRIDLPAGKSVKLQPGGYHVMLIDIRRQLKPGETVQLSLSFEGRDRTLERVEVKATVREGRGAGHPR